MKKLLLTILGVLAGIQISYGAIALVSTSTAANNQGTVASTNLSNTCGAGTNFVIVDIGYIHTGQSVSTLTYGAASMTKIGRKDNGTNIGSEMWYYATTTTAANTITATYSASIQQPRLGVLCLSGVDTASPIGATSTAGANGSQPSGSIVTTTANSWIHDTTDANAEELATPSAGQLQRWISVNGNGNNDTGGSTLAASSTGTYNIGWSAGGAAPNWTMFIAEIKPESTPAVSAPSTLGFFLYNKFK